MKTVQRRFVVEIVLDGCMGDEDDDDNSQDGGEVEVGDRELQ